MVELIPNWLQQRAFLTPQRIGLVFNEQTWTFHDMLEIVNDYSSRLHSIITSTDTKVAVLMKNHPDTVWVLHALQQLGIEIVFLNNRLTVAELHYQVKDSKATILLYDCDFRQTAEELHRFTNIPFYTSEDILGMKSTTFQIRENFILHDVCSIMYTSGTTGKPKGVIQTYGNHWWSAIGSSLNLGLHSNDAWLCSLPLYHISGFSILMRSVIYGIPVYLMEKFNPVIANNMLISGNITIMSSVSNMLSRMLNELGDNVYHENFRCMLLGGGPAPYPILQKCKEKGIPVFQTYGMTESCSQIVTLAPEDSMEKLGSAGKPLFPAQIKIMNNGEIAAPFEAGEIMLKGPNVTQGYFNLPDVNEKAFQHGWFSSGDVGYIDDEGFLYVLDRRSDLIISGGENIYPAEIEATLMEYDGVLEAGVTGIEDSEWGQVPYAFIVADKQVTSSELIQFCQERLASYKVPKKIIQVEELPRNGANKLQRRKLPQLLVDGDIS
ncbi:o-succinylbenzoate--CoA ligase [Lederbergia graminis]|uniref:2-succinylbenzoate--CoA ligase n=1 Tax=Lederbergia graminis TaxID=735518 RepID=A0ABW0LMK7_9BACI